MSKVLSFAGFQATGATLATLQYPFLVYTTTVDSVEGALRLARQTPNILCYLPSSNSGKMVSRFESVTSKKIIQINFCGLCYLTVLVYTKVSVASGE